MGQPTPGAIDLQPPATSIMQQIRDFHGFLLPIIVAVSVFVLALLLWVIIRYNRRNNPTPRKFTHNMLVEVIWTIVPVLILVAIAWRSFPLIFREERIPSNAEITLKVTGNQWFWQYEYPDQHVSVTSLLQSEADVAAWNAAHPDPAQHRTYLLATTSPIVVPMDTTVRVLVTSNDVIHAWAIPAFGVKEDATQGRVNDSWFRIESRLVGQGEHTFYGECSELCGKDHAYMPIEVRAVPRDEFNRWLASQGGTMAFGQAAAAPAAATTTAAPGAPAPASGSAPTPAQPPTHAR
ncbi:MAG: cytochrome c oxidase subunit II [Proteobacteria bacterium]|nr:cytochrome c oxidase subunit II [Pseudomonadota bacterium]